MPGDEEASGWVISRGNWGGTLEDEPDPTLDDLADELGVDDPGDDVANVGKLLRSVGGSDIEVQLYRKAPSYAQGFLGTIVADPNDPAGLVEQIARDYGGHRIMVRPVQVLASGQKRWLKGSSYVLRISRPPLVDGRPWSDKPPIIDVPAVPVRQYQDTAPMRSGNPSVDALAALLDRVTGPIVSRLERLETRLEPAEKDPFAGVDRLLGVLEKVDRFRGRIANPQPVDEDDEDDEDDDEDGEGEGWQRIAAKLIDKKFPDAPEQTPAAEQPDGWRLLSGGKEATAPGSSSGESAPSPNVTQQIGALLKGKSAEEIAAVLGDLQEHITPEVQAELLRRAQSMGKAG